MVALAARARISIVGGNIARSPGPLIVDVTVTGSVHRRRVLTRRAPVPATSCTSPAPWRRSGWACGCCSADRRRAPDTAVASVPAARAAQPLRPAARPQPGGARLYRSQRWPGRRRPANRRGERPRRASSRPTRLPIEDGRDAWRRAGRRRRLRALVCGITQNALAPEKRAAPRASDLAITRIGRLTADRALVVSRNGSTEELPAGFVHF